MSMSSYTAARANPKSRPCGYPLSLISLSVVVGFFGVRTTYGSFLSHLTACFLVCLCFCLLFLQNTELVEDLLSKHCPDVMDHLRMVHLELIVLTPR